ncbi:MAG: metallophosphoesterase [Gemmatimonadota bacterium]|nr:metallophosphoesterase [Gemmatimonadota bacterium]
MSTEILFREETMNLMRLAKRIGAALLGFVVLLLVWGSLIEPRLIDERRETAAIPNLPAEWEGRRVALIADFQIGMWGANTGTIRRIVGRLMEERPAAVLIAGDFVYKPDDRLGEITAEVGELVAPLVRAGIPTFAVLGNHDYSMDLEDDPINPRVAEAVEATLEAAGVRVLHNEAVPLTPAGTAAEGTPLYVVGIGSAWAGLDRPAEAMARVPANAPRFVFMHNPTSFQRLPAGTAPIAVAAHTHGGQIAVPYTPSWSWMRLVKDHVVGVDGWAEDDEGARGNRLYVNVGIGFSDVPIRINAPPELTWFTLRRGAPLPTLRGG